MILKIVEKTERIIVIALLLSLLLVVFYTTVVFLVLLFSGILSGIQESFSENHILSHLHSVFGGFLLVLIGIELLHTIKMYLEEEVVHVEVVLLVALIGISRHAIDLDLAHLDPIVLFGLSALILSLSGGYLMIKKGMIIKKDKVGE